MGIDKLVLLSKEELVIIYMHKEPVTITGPDALAVWFWLNTPTPLRLEEFTRATVCDLEVTQVAA